MVTGIESGFENAQVNLGLPDVAAAGLNRQSVSFRPVNGLTGCQALHAAHRADKERQHSPGLARSLASVLGPIEKRINVPKRSVRDSKTGESGQNALPLVVPGQLEGLENVMVLLISTAADLWINENPARNRHALTSTDSSRILMVASMECQATVIKMYFKNFSEIIISSRIMDKLLILVILVSVQITPLVRIPVMWRIPGIVCMARPTILMVHQIPETHCMVIAETLCMEIPPPRQTISIRFLEVGTFTKMLKMTPGLRFFKALPVN